MANAAHPRKPEHQGDAEPRAQVDPEHATCGMSATPSVPEDPATDGDAAAPGAGMVRPVSAESLFPLAYDELLRVARLHLIREQAGHTLNTTALVHETYLKLAGREGTEWRERRRFLAVASRAMRQILVDHARARRRQKRGGGVWPVTLRTDAGSGQEEEVDLLALDEALEKLAEHEIRLAHVVECRFFGGLTATETAEALGVSLRTVERDWTRARSHLLVLLGS